MTVPKSNGKAFTDRLRQILGKESARSFALRAGIPPTSMNGYLSGKNEPTRPVLVAIAAQAGVSVQWLATGDGQMRAAEDPLSYREGETFRLPEKIIDAELLGQIADGISKVYKVAGARISPIDQGRLAAEYLNKLMSTYDEAGDRYIALKMLLTSLRSDLEKSPEADTGSSKRSA